MSKKKRQEVTNDTPGEQADRAGLVSFADVTETKVEQSGPVGEGQFIYVDISSVDNKLKRIAEPKTLDVSAAPSRAKQKLQTGDVLVSMTRPNLNAVAMVPPELDGSVGSTGFHVLRANEGTEPRWLYYTVQTHHFVSAMSELVQGALYPAVRPKDIRAFEIPHPPLDQQKRIVAEIEKQFSRLDEAVANLKRVKANLKRYKAALLKAAVEGRLVETEAELARREGRNYETGEQLLQRILETRRSQWKGKGKYKEPAAPDTTDLPELPEGWVYATAEQLTDENRAITYGVIKLGVPVDGGVPVLRSSDVRQLRIDLDDVKRISPDIAENYRRTFLKGGEVVMTVRGTLGGIAVVPLQCSGFNVSREVAMLALVEKQMAQLVAHFVASAPLGNWLMRRTKGIAYTGINIESLKALPIPVPPISEQILIVAEVERRLSLLRETEAQVDGNLQRAERLRQSILSSAFAGRIDQSGGMVHHPEEALMEGAI